MKIYRFNELVNENKNIFNDSPESYVENVLLRIKKKIENFFTDVDKSNTVVKIGDKEFDTKIVNKDKHLSFSDLGLELLSSEFFKNSILYDSVSIKFIDDTYLYDLYLMIKLEEVLPLKNTNKQIEESDITKCFVKFKKINKDTLELEGRMSANIDVKDIDEDLIVKLKEELDKDVLADQSDLDIEYEK